MVEKPWSNPIKKPLLIFCILQEKITFALLDLTTRFNNQSMGGVPARLTLFGNSLVIGMWQRHSHCERHPYARWQAFGGQ